jgi:uncharacterized membrane protein YbaN (DUF454 family)
MVRTTYVLVGHTSLAIGFVGIFVPLLPTTPFVLLAAVCYSRGSERFHTWLHRHPRFGPMIHQWRENHAIDIRSKVIATVMVVLSIAYSVYRLDPPWNVVALLIGATVLTFILSRPSAPGHDESSTIVGRN